MILKSTQDNGTINHGGVEAGDTSEHAIEKHIIQNVYQTLRKLKNKHTQHANSDAALDVICLAIVQKSFSINSVVLADALAITLQLIAQHG